MANQKVALMRRVKTPAGWRYYPAAYALNGRVKPGFAVVDGEEIQHRTGYYALRYSKGSKLIFESLKGISPAAAEARRTRKEAQFSVVFVAKKVELKVEPIDPQRNFWRLNSNSFWPTLWTGDRLKPRKSTSWLAMNF